MTSTEIRQSFLHFFKEKQHTIVPSSSLLPDAPNLLFTNAGMNQFVPIFLGQAPCPYKPARAADTQKCIRAGGKHNDLEDVGFDTYHHTFFEMLGNWSFGDYFKKDAIEWAWELVVGRWKFPASRIYATIYSPGPGDPASLDREAHEHWSEIFINAGLDPAYHVVHGNKKDNFWMMGDTGPCGPCSELHVDLTPGPRDLDIPRQIAGRNLVNQGDARCIEIWNLVFIQFNANPDGTFVDLPARHVDTGMGFERVTSMIQGTKNFTDFENAKISNYETDVFRPLFDELEKITGKKYKSTLPASAQNLSEDEKVDVAFRVIADHIRTLSFSIADGISPSNEGRGYVLRRILRRAVRYGRTLGLRDPFLGKLVDVLGTTMGHIFPEVVAKADHVRKTLTQEEEGFFRTLERGIELFEMSLDSKLSAHEWAEQRPAQCSPEVLALAAQPKNVFPGLQAFRLYDTYGFPLDLTELMARERGMVVDVAEFNRLMDEQKARARASQEKDIVNAARSTIDFRTLLDEEIGFTKFNYDFCELKTSVAGAAGGSASADIIETDSFIPKETPFYSAMGGQVGDVGFAMVDNYKIAHEVVRVEKIASGAIIHDLKTPTHAIQPGTPIFLVIDCKRRAKIEAHHSGTHIMHWALRKVLGTSVSQKGSYVGPDRLRFDFSHGAAVTPAELAEIEKLVNDQIADDVPVTWDERPYADVKGDPSILQFFGDKYGDKVRVVSIGDFSKELCGGTHVRHSAQIGFFKILHESAIAAGIRRIEAASGPALIEFVEAHLPKQQETYAALRARKPNLAPLQEFSGEKTPEALWKHWEARETFLRQTATEVAMHEKDEARHREAAYQKEAAAEAAELIGESRAVGLIPYIVHVVDAESAAYLPFLADALKHKWKGVAVLATIEGDKVSLLAAVAPEFTKQVQAGKIIQAIAPLVGGKGGGRPDLAQGGGNNPQGVPAALEKAEEILEAIK